jgi:hypothetical protein
MTNARRGVLLCACAKTGRRTALAIITQKATIFFIFIINDPLARKLEMFLRLKGGLRVRPNGSA